MRDPDGLGAELCQGIGQRHHLEPVRYPGSGFIAEVSLTPDFSRTEQSVGDIPAGGTSYAFTGLSQAQHYYHVRTKTLSGVCSAGDWSTPVSTIQDATPPVAPITSPQDGDVESGTTLTVAGTIADPPGGAAPSGSGPAAVLVNVQGCVYVALDTCLGTGRVWSAGESAPQLTNGNWNLSFGNLSCGPYLVQVTGVDNVGNYQTVPTRIAVVGNTDNAASPSTALDGAGDGYGYTTTYPGPPYSVFQFFEFSLAGTYDGTPASGSWSCQPDYAMSSTGNVSDLQCSAEDNLANDFGVGSVMPSSFVISNVVFTLSPGPTQWGGPVAAFSLAGSIFNDRTFSCVGLAQESAGEQGVDWSLTAPDVTCTVV